MDAQQKLLEFFLVGSGGSPFIGLLTQSWEVFVALVLITLFGTIATATMLKNSDSGDE